MNGALEVNAMRFILTTMLLAAASANCDAADLIGPYAAKELPENVPAFAARHALRHGRINLDRAELARLRSDKATADATLELFPNERINVRFNERPQRSESDGLGTVIGRPITDQYGYVSLTQNGQNLYGTVQLGDRVYTVFTDDRTGRDFVKEVDLSSLPPTHAKYGAAEEPFGISAADVVAKVERDSQSKVLASRTVDVAVAYTNAVANQAYDEVALVNNAAANMNAGIAASGADAAIRVIGYRGTTYSESGKTGQQVLQDNYLIASSNPGLNDFTDQRSALRADFMVVLFDAGLVTDTCGVALSPQAYGSGQQGRAYAVVGDDCATATHTFSHEVGHLFAGNHQRTGAVAHISDDNDANPYSVNDPDPPITGIPGASTTGAINHGFYWTTPSTQRDIMAVGPGCTVSSCARRNEFSNPANGTGVALGSAAAADMKSTLDFFVTQPVGYETAGSSVPATPTGFYAETGCPFAEWTNSSGTVGWYEVFRSSSSSFSSQTQVYRGPNNLVSTSGTSGSTWFRARACNANGCSAYTAGDPC